ncbi:hypothetical protein FB451DRAFT_1171345 [Mycena latifolia]|nr:hypothetical protein FB451DRAFT_1171345 [Mycena latifolia]
MSTPGTSAAPIANGASGFKVPNPWDKNSPSFDGQTADSLLRYFRHCEMIIEGANINDDKGKKAVLMKYVDRPVQEIWEGLATFASDTFVKWSKEVRSLYPEIKELENGSLERIKEISAAARNLGRHQQGLIKCFGLTFGIEAKKISKPPCLLTNKQLVDLYLTSFEHDFRREIEMMIRQTQYYREVAGPIQGPATQAGVNPNGTNTKDVERPEDTIPLQELFDMVNSMAKTYSGVTPVEVKLNGEARSISKDKIPPLSFDSTGGNQLVKIKTEIDERFDIFSNDIAQLKDGHKTQQKHMESGFDRLEKTVRQVMSQASRGPAPHQELNTTVDSGNKDQDRSLKSGLFDRPYKSNEDRACFYCLIAGHMVRDCPYKQEHIDAGQLIIEDNRMKMGDGTPLPSWPQDKSKKQRVDDYYIGKTIPGAPHVSMRAYTPLKPSIAQFHAQVEEVESLYSLYDTRDDEIRSHRVQKQIAKNSGKTDNYQPTFLALQQQSHNTATYTPNNQGISYSINQASAVPIAGAPAGMDIICGYKTICEQGWVVPAKFLNGSRKAEKTKAGPKSRSTKPPENRNKEVEMTIKQIGVAVESEESEPEESEPEESMPSKKKTVKFKDVDDPEFDRSHTKMPYRQVPEAVMTKQAPRTVVKTVMKGQEDASREIYPISQEKAYRLIAPVQRKGVAEDLLKEVTDIRVPVPMGDLVAASPELARLLRKAITKVRQPVVDSKIALIQGLALPYTEDDDIPERLGYDAIGVGQLPQVDVFYIATEEDRAICDYQQGELALQFGFNENGEIQIEKYLQPNKDGVFTEQELATGYIEASEESEALKNDKIAAQLFGEYVRPNRKARRKKEFQGVEKPQWPS